MKELDKDSHIKDQVMMSQFLNPMKQTHLYTVVDGVFIFSRIILHLNSLY